MCHSINSTSFGIPRFLARYSAVRRWSIAAAILLTVACALTPRTAGAQETALEGTWKMVVLTYGEYEFLVLDIASEPGQLVGQIKDQQRFLAGSTIKSVSLDGDQVTITVAGSGAVPDSVFRGRLMTDGDFSGSVLGTFQFRGAEHPTRLEPTDTDNVGPLNPEATQQLRAALGAPDAESRVTALTELLAETPGPANARIYTALLGNAEEAGLEPNVVQGHIDDWLASAAVYGEVWKNQSRSQALQALSGSKPYADVSLSLAQAALAELNEDADASQQASVLTAVVSAARLADAADLADSAAARLEKINEQLDAEYLATVPPFKPGEFAGRDDPAHDRAVLLELFTGAECPPCVAADVAFDALLKTYQPSELVTLQYHLHIPGPDPLTNEDAIARSGYYSLRGTPSPYFNGQDSAPGGGSMAGAEAKYGQYREVIAPQLNETADAKIDLKVTRSGSQIIIQATAEADIASAEAAEDADDDDAVAAETPPELRLRLALTEESIRYVGGNGLRFHHHVVRALPGGPEGTALADGRAKVEITIDLEEVRQTLQRYVDGYQRGFPRPVPEIELHDLSIVAFVQNDADKNVWQAVTTGVPEE